MSYRSALFQNSSLRIVFRLKDKQTFLAAVMFTLQTATKIF